MALLGLDAAASAALFRALHQDNPEGAQCALRTHARLRLLRTHARPLAPTALPWRRFFSTEAGRSLNFEVGKLARSSARAQRSCQQRPS